METTRVINIDRMLTRLNRNAEEVMRLVTVFERARAQLERESSTEDLREMHEAKDAAIKRAAAYAKDVKALKEMIDASAGPELSPEEETRFRNFVDRWAIDEDFDEE